MSKSSRNSAARQVVPTKDDPTLQTHDITIDGIVYTMCFDFRSLALGESKLVAEGHDVNILLALPRLDLSSTMILFAASIQRFHPKIGFDDAQALLTPQNVYQVQAAIIETWRVAMPEPEEHGKNSPPVPAP